MQPADRDRGWSAWRGRACAPRSSLSLPSGGIGARELRHATARAFLAWMLALMAMRNYASPPYSNRANRLECQTGVHGDFDPQRLSGALANPIELTSFVAAVLNRIDSVTGVGLNQEEQ